MYCKDIAIQLELAIKYWPGNTNEDSFRHMIKTWVQQKNPPPMWLSFVEALERLRICQNLSSHLRSKYCKYYYTV